MAQRKTQLLAFNRGVISPKALARVDIKRVALSAETQTNWMPLVLGPMSLRPGTEYIGATYGNLAARHIPFIFSVTDTAILEFTDLIMRVWINDVLLTRPSVSTAVANGSFTTDLANWTDADEGSATSAWLTGGYMDLRGDGTNAAIRTQTLTIAGGDQNVEHALRIVVTRGACLLRAGSTSGGDEYISETTLNVGTHSLAFTPTGASVYLRLFNRDDYSTLVDSCTIEAAGVVTLPTPYGASNLSNIRYDQSGDVVFAAASGVRQQRVERRATRSWSVADYAVNDGPFRIQNLTPITLTASALIGEITLTASKPVFTSSNVGSLFSLTSTGQTVTKSLGAADVFSDPILVQGLSAVRGFTINISGTWVATITLQRSVGEVGSWTDVTTYTTNQTSLVYNDALDNQTIYYRIGIKAGDYTSGTASASLAYAFGSIKGIVRVVGYTSSTVVTAVVLKDLGALSATSQWAEGAWSARRGYPSAVALHEGRLWWAGKDKIQATVSDAFDMMDPDYEGDAGPIDRSIGSGPVDTISWMASAQRLLIGAQAAELTVKSSAIDEPITPTAFTLKSVATYGSAAIDAVKIDSSAVFVDRSGSRVMELAYDGGFGSNTVNDLTMLAPEVCEPYVVRIAVQRRPDTRLHCVLSDGTVAILVFDKAEDVKCWVKFETDGLVEDVVIMPSTLGVKEDRVYYTVARTINGSTVRYLEKLALMSECVGGTVNKQADAFYYWTGASSPTITGLTHLIAESVVCWANGKDQGTFTVDGSGTITLTESVTSAVVGLTYTAKFKSTKLANSLQGESLLTEPKRVDHLGLILKDTHAQGLKYGSTFDTLDDLPLVEDGVEVAGTYVWDTYDHDGVEFNGEFDTDSRICLQATAPRPCTVLAAIVSMISHDK